MPLSTNYLENNDYASLKYSPYQLNVNDVAKTLAIKTAYWNQGAQKIKSKYDSALNLNLTTQSNKLFLKDYIQKSEQEIKNLSSQELSNPDIQEQGIKLFDGLFENRSVMFDNALTKVKGSIYQQAEAAKNTVNKKTGKVGEAYADSNLRDALDGFQNFNENTPGDENTLSSLYQQLGHKLYIPFYDVDSEMFDILKNCKGPSTTSADDIGPYIKTTKQSGASDQRLNGCLTTSLSDQAKTQLGISARQSFKNGDGTINYGALTETFNNQYSTLSESIKTEKEQIEGRIVALTKLQKSNKDPQIQKQIDFENSLLKSSKESYTNLAETFKKLNIQDRSYVDANFNGISQGLYFRDKVNGFSQAFRNDVTETKLEENAVFLQKERLAADHIENALNRTHQLTLENNRFEHEKTLKGLDVNGNTVASPDRDTPVDDAFDATTKNENSNAIEEFNKEISSDQKEVAGITEEFYNKHISQEWEAQGKTKEQFFDIKTGVITPAGKESLATLEKNKDPNVAKFNSDLALYHNKSVINNAVLSVMDNDPTIKELSQSVAKKLENKEKYPDIEINGQMISQAEINNALSGKSSLIKILNNGNIKSLILGNSIIAEVRPRLEGVPGGSKSWFSRIPKLGSVLEKIENKNGDANIKLIERKNEILGEHLSKGSRRNAFTFNASKNQDVRSQILTAVKDVGGQGVGLEEVQGTSYDPKTGSISISITKKNKESILPSEEELLKRLKSLRKADSNINIYRDKNNSLIVNVTVPELVDKELISNPYIHLEKDINNLETSIKKGISSEPGKPITNYSLTFPAAFGSKRGYIITPSKDRNGEITWDMSVQYTGTTTKDRIHGNYYPNEALQNLKQSEVISQLNPIKN